MHLPCRCTYPFHSYAFERYDHGSFVAVVLPYSTHQKQSSFTTSILVLFVLRNDDPIFSSAPLGASPRWIHQQPRAQYEDGDGWRYPIRIRIALSSSSQPQRRFKSTRPDPQNSNKTPLSLMDSATDLFVAMRWKAAHALTTSLSDDERSELLQRLDPAHYNKIKSSSKEQEEEDNDKNELKMQHSIAEAVAAARAQEAQRSREQWENERATLMREAEEAARARVESDLAILQEQQRLKAFEQWQQQVEEEKKKQEQAADKEPAATSASTGGRQTTIRRGTRAAHT